MQLLAPHPSRLVLYLDHFRFLDDDVVFRDVLVHSVAPGGHTLDLVDHFAAFDHAPEHAVTVSIRGGGAEIKEIVSGDVDEELRRRRVGIGVRAIATV